MSLPSAYDAKQKSLNNLQKKSFDVLMSELIESINNSSDFGYFSVTFVIPRGTPNNIKEAVLNELNKNKYVVTSSETDNGLVMGIEWGNPRQ